ncbi:MAG: hypothetical protein ABSF54_27085 [Bryobacteraceae bacterium]
MPRRRSPNLRRRGSSASAAGEFWQRELALGRSAIVEATAASRPSVAPGAPARAGAGSNARCAAPSPGESHGIDVIGWKALLASGEPFAGARGAGGA